MLIGTNEPAWYCVRTARGCEEAVIASLRDLHGCEVFFPRMRTVGAEGQSGIFKAEPLFKSFVFARNTLSDLRLKVAATKGARGIVRMAGHCPKVPVWIIEQLKTEFDAAGIRVRPLPRVRGATEIDCLVNASPGLRRVLDYDLPASQRVQILMDTLRRGLWLEKHR